MIENVQTLDCSVDDILEFNQQLPYEGNWQEYDYRWTNGSGF